MDVIVYINSCLKNYDLKESRKASFNLFAIVEYKLSKVDLEK